MTIEQIRAFKDAYIRNSAIEAFTNLRLNTILEEFLDKLAESEGLTPRDYVDLNKPGGGVVRLSATDDDEIIGTPIDD